MLVLFETATGYAIFKLLNKRILKKKRKNIRKYFSTPEKANETVKLITFKKFDDTADASEVGTSLTGEKCSKTLNDLLKQLATKGANQLVVGNAKLGNLIEEKFNLPCVANKATADVMRGIKSNVEALLGDVSKTELLSATLDPATSLADDRVKIDSKRIDVRVCQAVSWLDDLDKKFRKYVLRCREWYGWHFPELGEIVSDHLAYAKIIKNIGMRQNMVNGDFGDILSEELAEKVKHKAEMSMGVDISESDIANIKVICDRILQISDHRAQLSDYLNGDMAVLAPNLSVLLDELARSAQLGAHTEPLVASAKKPAPTVEISGAEKMHQPRTRKRKQDPAMYGHIYYAQLLGQPSPKDERKKARELAAKVSRTTGSEAVGDETIVSTLNVDSGATLEAQMKVERKRDVNRLSGTGRSQANNDSYQSKGEAIPNNDGADSTIRARTRNVATTTTTTTTKKPKRSRLRKKARAKCRAKLRPRADYQRQ